MAQEYKYSQIQGTSSLSSYVTLYSTPVGKESLISTILICNTSGSNATVRVGLDASDGGIPDALLGEWLLYDTVIEPNDTMTLSLGISMSALKYLRVSSSTNSVNFTAFVLEMTSSIGTVLASGNNTEIQYNNNGVLGSSPNFTFDGTTLDVTGDLNFTGNLTQNGSPYGGASKGFAIAMALIFGS